MTPVWGYDDQVIPFVVRVCDLPRGISEAKAMGVLNGDGQLVAGLVFHNWQPEAGVIEVTAGATDRRWATRGVLGAATRYAYGDCGCQMIVARTSEKNAPTRRLWRAMGATEYIIPRLRGRDEAEIILTLTKEDWSASKFARKHG